MGINIEQHVKEKKLLLSQYDKILKSEYLLKFDINIDDISERVENLKNERFFISICGQMNSGKSTLLNSYIFGDLILPFDNTTQTAKLTIMEYSEKPYFVPVFYTEKEWDQVKSVFKVDEKSSKEFKDSLKIAEEAGINLNDIFEKKDKIYELKKLSEYVAIPAHGGIYSPFVNYVNLYFPNEILKEVTIVDTPGINDPNKIRESITLEWVKKSDAVVYVTNAKNSFNENDLNFIDKNLIHIPKENILIAINKADIVKNTESINEWLNGLLEKDIFKFRKIYDKTTPRIFVCSLGELIRKMNENNIDLTEDLIHYFNLYKSTKVIDFTISKNNNIEKLGKAIEEKLVKNKGFNLVRSHKEFIETLFKRILKGIDLEIENLQLQQSDFNKNDEQLNDEIKKLDEQIINIENENKKLDFKMRELKNELSNIQANGIRTLKDDIVMEIRKNLNELDDIESFNNQVPWIFKRIFENNIEMLEKTFKKVTNYYNSEIENKIESFLDMLSKNQMFSKQFLKANFDLSIFELSRGFRNEIDKTLKSDAVESKIKKITSGFQRFFNTAGGRKKAVDLFTNEADIIVNEEITSIQKISRDKIAEHVGKVFAELNSKANKIIFESSKSKKKVLNKRTDKDKEVKELKEKVQKLIQSKNDIILSEKEILK